MAGQTTEPGARSTTNGVALRPFALPTDTSVRFLLLVAAVSTASLYLFQALWIVARSDEFLDTIERCGLGNAAGGLLGTETSEVQRVTACRAGLSQEQGLFALVGVAVVLLVAWTAYRLRPAWRDRRSNLEPLHPTDCQHVIGDVATLSEQARLPAPPSIRLDPVNPGLQAFAYGAGDDHRLGMTGGLLAQHYADRGAFTAVVRHELAHLANRDVAWAYYTVSVWWAFLLVALVPVIAVFLVSDPQYILRLGWRTAALALLVAVVGSGLLRAREVYADARAAEWGSHPDLDRVLAAQPAERGRRPWWLRLHPAASKRRTLLADSDGLFTADTVTAAATGITGGLAFASLHSFMYLFVPGSAVLPMCALLVAPLIAAVLCVTAWRVGLREAVRGVVRPLGVPMGLGLGVGLAVAPALSIQSARSGVTAGADGWAGYVVWGIGTVAASVLLCRWIVDSARVRVASVLAAASPRRALLGQIALSSVAIAMLLVIGSYVQLFLTTAGLEPLRWGDFWLLLPGAVGELWQGLAPVVAVTALLVTPLLARRDLRRRRMGAPVAAVPEHWAWRHTHSVAEAAAERGNVVVPSLRSVVIIGIATGVGAAGLLVVARLVGATLDDATRRSDAYALALGEGVLGTAIAAMLVASVAAAIVLPGRWWMLSVIAGAVASVIASLGGLVASVAAGCGLLPTTDPGCALPAWSLTRFLALAPLSRSAIPAFLLVAAVGAWRAWRASRGRAVREHSGASERRHVVIAAAVAAAVTAVWAGGEALGLLRVDAPLVQGPGYTVAVPGQWVGQLEPDSVTAVFVTLAQDVQVVIVPEPDPSPPTTGESVNVGGFRGFLVASRDDGSVRLLAYDVQSPSGSYRVFVQGSVTSLTESRDDVEQLLSAVAWQQ